MKKYNVILSGGIGTRLWPLSRAKCPKQFVQIFDNASLFQHTVKRNAELCDAAIMVGNTTTTELWRNQLLEIDHTVAVEIIEAVPRNTAAAIAFAALSVEQDDLLFVTPCDHQIADGPDYAQAVNRAFELAMQDKLVTFGILPVSPHTGYGYIQHKGESVLAFVEKPDEATAISFLTHGGYLWNSGMFCFRAGKFLSELQQFQPEIFAATVEAYSASTMPELDIDLSMKIPSLSIDYAVMEKSKDIAVVPSFFKWSDLGSYSSLKEYFAEEGRSSHIREDNLVFSSKSHVSIMGLSNIVVVDDDDVLLICHEDSLEQIKEEYTSVVNEKPECR